MHRTKSLLLIVVVSAIGVSTGCQSSGTRTAWWKPSSMWASDKAVGGEDETALAQSAPELPSTKFDSAVESSSALADAPASTPASSAGTIASAPKAEFPESPTTPTLTSAPAYEAPTATTVASATTPNATAMAPQQSPYSNQPVSATVASTPSSAPAETDRYGATDRYAEADRYASGDRYAMNSTPAATTPTPESTPVGSTAHAGGSQPADRYSQPPADRYSQYSDPTTMNLPSLPETTPGNPTTSVATTTPDASATVTQPDRYQATRADMQPAATASAAPQMASVSLPATPGGYRPGGTSTYPTTGAAATSIATRPETPESASGYGTPRYSTPADSNSGSTPSYR